MRSAVATRLLTRRLFEYSTLARLILFSGQSPNPDAKAEALRTRDTSAPISHRRVWAVMALMPGTLVRSTPKIRYSSWRRSNVFGSYRGRLYGEALVRLGTAGSAVIAVSRLPS